MGPLVKGEFPSQVASNAESVSVSSRYHMLQGEVKSKTASRNKRGIFYTNMA